MSRFTFNGEAFLNSASVWRPHAVSSEAIRWTHPSQMANTNAPFGALPLSTVGGQTGYATRMIPAAISSSDTTKIYKGDFVKFLDTGLVGQWSAGTAVSQLAGIFWGCRYLSISQGKLVYNNYWPGSDAAANADIYLIPATGDVPMLVRMQTDSTGAAVTDRWANFDVSMGTGSTVTGMSAMVLATATPGTTTATLPCRLIDLWSNYGTGSTTIGNGTQAGAYNQVVVQLNTSGAGATGL